MKRPLAVLVLMGLTLFQGVSGIAGGVRLLANPGEGGWFPLEWLEGSPFDDYLIPGLVLLLVLGVYPVVLLFAQRRGLGLAWWGSGALGMALVVWILVEVWIAGSQDGTMRVLQIVYGTVGVAIVALTLLAPVKRHFGVAGR